MTYASLFSGAGGFDIGLDRAGLDCRFQCEIDPQASKVLFRHWPDVPKHTDVRQVKKKHAPRVDLVVGGFPCQDLSVAGKREGLKGERSGLFYELLRVVGLCKPEFVLWENVPGLLSSDDGRDFARVLRGLADCGYFGAWRVLDARFFGVPQRRRRVFGLFARGRFGAVRCAEILALTKGVCGDTAAGREAGKDVAFTLTSSVGRNSGGTRVGNAWNTNYVADALRASDGRRNGQPAKGWEPGRLVPVAARCLTSRGNRQDGETDTLIAFSAKDHGADAGSVSPTLRAGGFRDSHQNGGVMPAVCVTGSVTHTLTSQGADASEDGTGRGTPVVACVPIDMRQASRGETMTNNRKAGTSGGAPGTGIGNAGDPSPSLSNSHTPAVGFVPDVAQPIRSNVFNNSDPRHGGDHARRPGRQRPTTDAPRVRAVDVVAGRLDEIRRHRQRVRRRAAIPHVWERGGQQRG